ncbi:MAG TPA: sugar phosphate nucleotidyltransferase [Acidobacteriota bacterium]|nr:sugar phosphate nucleotidyltransferase [Acidobacteriota bacterium]
MQTSRAEDSFEETVSVSSISKNPGRHPCLEMPGLWSVVLAGGEGNRIRTFIQGWLGRHRPKQYCTFVGTRSLLQHTLDRAGRLVPDERTLVVIDRTHRQIAESQIAGRSSIRLIVQPCNRDTAAGIFLPLTYIRRIDPEATVVIYPSDHFVYPENAYVGAVQVAVEEARCLTNRLLLLGVAPDELELEYGWVRPGPALEGNGGNVRSVEAFIEKPGMAEAKAVMESGALWNTFVLAAKVEWLWQLGWRFFPRMMPLFGTLEKAIGSRREGRILSLIYERMPTLNFSTNFLQRAPEHVGVMKLEGVLWSDWGRPERIVASLQKINRQPAFSLDRMHKARASASA